ncbi:NAD(P)H-dependent oxidoreductase [Hyalangium sp.]|uniref:NADPH-dependent FMN reductase n=1 Tax=Hyalangium sp. TaxID=2028555 RepID=UPI002D26F604|nr:NAD(P)H-dependent oxidoreductase [Hyalangium sp.]HYH97762.1 NAD(P)H-dependent oxidoreductase [Hyalangium sp.]
MMLKIALIVGSTRPQRFADTPGKWIVQAAKTRKDFELDVLDLRDQNLPFFEEPLPVIYTGGAYSHPAAEAWRQKLGAYDGFIVTAAEYNHGPTEVLKNALDSAYNEWHRKPIAFVGYGGVGGARAIEHLRGIAIELKMAPIKQEVNIAMEPMLGILRQGKSLDDYAYLAQSRDALFDELVWWADALKVARAKAVSEPIAA